MIDARVFSCPMPVVMVQKELKKTAPAVIRKPFDMIIERRRSEMCLVIEEIMSERLAIKAVVDVPLLI